tara:strand:- start:552 stop:716 length:165 start_codon:yes stop_codon:yes gene_type:complete
MFKYLVTYFNKNISYQPSSKDLPPHLRTNEFDIADAFICSLEIDEDNCHPDLEH